MRARARKLARAHKKKNIGNRSPRGGGAASTHGSQRNATRKNRGSRGACLDKGGRGGANRRPRPQAAPSQKKTKRALRRHAHHQKTTSSGPSPRAERVRACGVQSRYAAALDNNKGVWAGFFFVVWPRVWGRAPLGASSSKRRQTTNRLVYWRGGCTACVGAPPSAAQHSMRARCAARTWGEGGGGRLANGHACAAR